MAIFTNEWISYFLCRGIDLSRFHIENKSYPNSFVRITQNLIKFPFQNVRGIFPTFPVS